MRRALRSAALDLRNLSTANPADGNSLWSSRSQWTVTTRGHRSGRFCGSGNGELLWFSHVISCSALTFNSQFSAPILLLRIVRRSRHLTISSLDMANMILPRLSFLSIFVAFAPGLVAIFFVRRRLTKQLARIVRNSNHLKFSLVRSRFYSKRFGSFELIILWRKIKTSAFNSSNLQESRAERYRHQMICRSISAQIVLPLAYCAAAALWLLDVAGIVRCSVLQRGVYTVRFYT